MLAAVEEAAARRQWGIQEELLATLVEVVDSLRVSFIKTNSKSTSRTPTPIHIPRPHRDKTGPRPMKPGELAQQMMTGR